MNQKVLDGVPLGVELLFAPSAYVNQLPAEKSLEKTGEAKQV